MLVTVLYREIHHSIRAALGTVGYLGTFHRVVCIHYIDQLCPKVRRYTLYLVREP